MYGITTKNITNANGIQILKGEKVQCLFITELGNGDLNALTCSNDLENLNVYSYEYLDRKYNTILIRVMEG